MKQKIIDLNKTPIFIIIIEELTQALGLSKNSPLYFNSIFYETSSDGGFAREYTDRDREIIKLLYHPEMEVGLNENQVDRVLRQILSES